MAKPKAPHKPEQPIEGTKRGRPKTGKRSDPDYQQVTAWIRRDTYRRVTDRLWKEDRREFSVLIETLLEAWLKSPR